jgi:hypothetical protein
MSASVLTRSLVTVGRMVSTLAAGKAVRPNT